MATKKFCQLTINVYLCATHYKLSYNDLTTADKHIVMCTFRASF